MDEFRSAARRARYRLKSGFWERCKRDVEQGAAAARERGLNENLVKTGLKSKVISAINGEQPDEFYLKVKHLLDTCGEVSDAIGRLTDREYFETLSYAERQRYTLELFAKYLAALEKYKRDRGIGF